MIPLEAAVTAGKKMSKSVIYIYSTNLTADSTSIDRDLPLNGMKKDIHPKFNLATKATCSCGATYTVGSTTDAISVEICSSCHPYYTGNEKIIDAAGRVDRFKKRAAAGKATAKAKK